MPEFLSLELRWDGVPGGGLGQSNGETILREGTSCSAEGTGRVLPLSCWSCRSLRGLQGAAGPNRSRNARRARAWGQWGLLILHICGQGTVGQQLRPCYMTEICQGCQRRPQTRRHGQGEWAFKEVRMGRNRESQAWQGEDFLFFFASM